MLETSNANEEQRIVQTDVGAKDGQNKCPKCGATDISLNIKNGKLRCNYCRHEFEPEKIDGMEEDISKLEGRVIGSGAKDIVADTKDIITLKCSSCGAEVVIDTSETTNARCHWCRNTLSINQQVPNGSVPDVVLPFKLTKDEARAQIENFVNKRKFYANPQFKEEFTTENIMGVYLPYMVVDVNSHASFSGEGEHLVRSYTQGSDNNKRRYYDADLYEVGREFDLVIDDLVVESSKDKLNTSSFDKTTNVINSIMPFDVENSVKWDANYLKGYSSEKRDTNVDELQPLVNVQIQDIAAVSANETLDFYDRGVKWNKKHMDVKGQSWKAAYLPVWLYSYQEITKKEKTLHYVAVNARTKETMGSVPINKKKLLLVSSIIEIVCIILAGMCSTDEDSFGILFFLALLSGFIYFCIMHSTYRNDGARHFHEKETKKEVSNLKKVDKFIKSQKGLSNSEMRGTNNEEINGKLSNFASKLVDK